MANNDSIQYALSRIQILNDAIRSLRSVAQSTASQLSILDSSIVNQEKKDILIDGLEGLSVDAVEMKTRKDSLQSVCQYVLDNVEELTQ